MQNKSPFWDKISKSDTPRQHVFPYIFPRKAAAAATGLYNVFWRDFISLGESQGGTDFPVVLSMAGLDPVWPQDRA